MSTNDLKDRIEKITGESVLRFSPMGGGTFGNLYAVDTAGREEVVAKTAIGDSTLDVEGWMLQYLAEHADLPVPAVIHCDRSLLLMTRLPSGGGLTDTAQEHAADLIAALHTVKGDTFGLQRDTVIGPLPQPNAPCDTWVDFLRNRRLMPMGRMAAEAGGLPRDSLSLLDRFCAHLDEFIDEPTRPSLLHGDLWTGNILANNGRISGFIDPAIYYGHAEMDLAFSTMFGTFGARFFARYNEVRPIDPGFFEARKDICNLWPLLVHARLFGGQYGASALSILKRFI